jgi:hypothetical protein
VDAGGTEEGVKGNEKGQTFGNMREFEAGFNRGVK